MKNPKKLNVEEEDVAIFKQIAAKKRKPMSDLFHEWIEREKEVLK